MQCGAVTAGALAGSRSRVHMLHDCRAGARVCGSVGRWRCVHRSAGYLISPKSHHLITDWSSDPFVLRSSMAGLWPHLALGPDACAIACLLRHVRPDERLPPSERRAPPNGIVVYYIQLYRTKLGKSDAPTLKTGHLSVFAASQARRISYSDT